MKEFIRLFIEKQVNKVKQFVNDIIASEAFKLLHSFYENQSWELIKNGEVVFGYNDIQYLVNKDNEKFEVVIEQLYKTPEDQVHLVVAHKKFGHADLLFSIDEFILSTDKAFVVFSYHINKLTPFSDLDFFDKLKIYGANLIVKFFPETVNNTVFNNKELSEGVKSTVLNNKITIDFHDAVMHSPLGQKGFLDYQMLDFVQVTSINIHEKGFGVKIDVFIPDWFKSITLMLVSTLLRMKVYKTPAYAAGSFLTRFFPV